MSRVVRLSPRATSPTKDLLRQGSELAEMTARPARSRLHDHHQVRRAYQGVGRLETLAIEVTRALRGVEDQMGRHWRPRRPPPGLRCEAAHENEPRLSLAVTVDDEP